MQEITESFCTYLHFGVQRCVAFFGGATFRLIGIFLLLIPSPAVAALVPRRAAKHHGGRASQTMLPSNSSSRRRRSSAGIQEMLVKLNIVFFFIMRENIELYRSDECTVFPFFHLPRKEGNDSRQHAQMHSETCRV